LLQSMNQDSPKSKVPSSRISPLLAFICSQVHPANI
jgi:hypothetical protein